jgi:hypothetical protein
MLRTFHEKLEVFNLKEIEKFSVKAGIGTITSPSHSQRSTRFTGRG